jgi:hypothetical protein
VKAPNKEGAIREVRSWLKQQSWKEHRGVNNFIAKRANPKARASAKKPIRTNTAKSPSGSKPNPQQKFSKSTLAHLRKKFATLDGVNVARHRAAIDKVFAGTSRPILKQLASAKIEWISPAAQDALMARRNPAGKKQNLHPLEVGSNLAMILGGLDHLRGMMARSKKKKRATKKKSNSPRAKTSAKSSHKKPNLGIIDLAANLQAAQFLNEQLNKKGKKRNTKTVTRRSTKANGRKAASSRRTPNVTSRRGKKSATAAKPNPNDGRIFQEFTGSPSTKVTNGFHAHKSEPKNVDMLGSLTEIKLNNLNSGPILRFPIGVKTQNGKRTLVFSKALIDERGKTINPKRVHYLANPSLLCAKELGNGQRRLVIASKQPFVLANGGHENRVRPYGVVVQVSYRAPKPHLYDGDTRAHEHFHNLGEEGGRQPTLKLDNGWLRLHGGDYKIRSEGIRD